jgi:hypothetical protein
MSAAIAADCGDVLHDDARVHHARLRHSDMHAQLAFRDAAEKGRRLELRVAQLQNARQVERMRIDRDAEDFQTKTRVIRHQACDLKTQYETGIAELKRSHELIVAAKGATIVEKSDTLATIERSHATVFAINESTIRELKADNTKLMWLLIALGAVVVALIWATWSQASTIAAQAAGLADADAVAASKDVVTAGKDAAIDSARAALARCEAQSDVLKTSLKADFTSQLSAIHTAVTTSLTLELQPARLDRRQFATWHAGPVPPLYAFDRAWAAAVSRNGAGKVDIDSRTGIRAHVTQVGCSLSYDLTLRSSMPLYRLPPTASSAPARKQLPSYRVVMEAYPANGCRVGFVPSYMGANSTYPDVVPGASLALGGWSFSLHATRSSTFSSNPLHDGWVVMAPGGATCGVNKAPNGFSTYATTATVPPLPAGGAVELAVDYAAGTCRVAFYTPKAVAGKFAAAPFARMELRFVATKKYDGIPQHLWPSRRHDIAARSVPTEKDLTLHLYPAVTTFEAGAIWRFV